MVKKNKLHKSQEFRADMETIKKEDVKKLQETFRQFFGNDTVEMRNKSSKIRNKVYLFGFAITVFLVLIFLLTKNVKFIEI